MGKDIPLIFLTKLKELKMGQCNFCGLTTDTTLILAPHNHYYLRSYPITEIGNNAQNARVQTLSRAEICSACANYRGLRHCEQCGKLYFPDQLNHENKCIHCAINPQGDSIIICPCCKRHIPTRRTQWGLIGWKYDLGTATWKCGVCMHEGPAASCNICDMTTVEESLAPIAILTDEYKALLGFVCEHCYSHLNVSECRQCRVSYSKEYLVDGLCYWCADLIHDNCHLHCRDCGKHSDGQDGFIYYPEGTENVWLCRDCWLEAAHEESRCSLCQINGETELKAIIINIPLYDDEDLPIKVFKKQGVCSHCATLNHGEYQYQGYCVSCGVYYPTIMLDNHGRCNICSRPHHNNRCPICLTYYPGHINLFGSIAWMWKDSRWICAGCFEEENTIPQNCTLCGIQVPTALAFMESENSTLLTAARICINHSFVLCNDCGVYYDEQCLDQNYICLFCNRLDMSDCINCQSCNIPLVDLSSATYFIESIGWLCRDCFNDDTVSEESQEETCTNEHERPVAILNYSAKPPPVFIKQINNITDQYLGIELEVWHPDKNSHTSSHLSALKLIPLSWMYVKADSSVPRGFEIVTHPIAVPELYSRYKEVDTLLTSLYQLGYISEAQGMGCTAGMHIHFSKNSITASQLYKYLLFVYSNPSFIKLISQRPWPEFEQWARLSSDKEKLRALKKSQLDVSRHHAINLSSPDTVEVRIFKGTLNTGAFYKNIDTVMAIYTFVHSISLQDIMKNSMEPFLEWVSSHKHWYGWLNLFLTLDKHDRQMIFGGDLLPTALQKP
jgi:hypothetical protein